MEKKLLYIAVLIVILSAGGFFVWSKLHSKRAPVAENIAPVVPEQTVETAVEKNYPVAEEITFTDEQLKDYYAVYADPYVLHIRKALNDYLSGTNEGMEIPDAVIEKHDTGDGSLAGLAAFERSYYQSKFVVMALEDALMGGKTATIIFQDKPDRVFTAWIYRLGDDQYDLRGFWEDATATERIEEHLKTFGKYIFDKEHSL
jgi:hypothetical protein